MSVRRLALTIIFPICPLKQGARSKEQEARSKKQGARSTNFPLHLFMHYSRKGFKKEFLPARRAKLPKLRGSKIQATGTDLPDGPFLRILT
jgi:hypothetical protein